MELSKKQIVLISVISGVVLLLAVGAALFLSPGATDPPAATPEPSPVPTDPPTPTQTPAPTVFLLPLVPRWDTPQPTAEPSGTTGVFMPQSAAPSANPEGEASGPWA